jgi:hypothetical protein
MFDLQPPRHISTLRVGDDPAKLHLNAVGTSLTDRSRPRGYRTEATGSGTGEWLAAVSA